MTNNLVIAAILTSKWAFHRDPCMQAIRAMCVGSGTFYAQDLPGLENGPRAAALMRQLHLHNLIEKTGNKRSVIIPVKEWILDPKDGEYHQETVRAFAVKAAEWHITFDPLKVAALLDALED